MFGSKTSKLLSTLEKYKYQHKKVVVFKPRIDDRYSTDEVVTHGGWKTPAVCVKTGADVLEYLVGLSEEPNVVAVDEAFMIPGISEALVWLYSRRKAFSRDREDAGVGHVRRKMYSRLHDMRQGRTLHSQETDGRRGDRGGWVRAL
jgi:hypothetical protein